MEVAILLDLETPSLTNKSPFQISCKVYELFSCKLFPTPKNYIFNKYIQTEDFSFNSVNKSYCENGKLVQNGKEIEEKITLKEALIELHKWLYDLHLGETYLIGHNLLSFDWPIISNLFLRFGITTEKKLKEDGFSLIDSRFFIPAPIGKYCPHDSLNDVLVLERLLNEFGVNFSDFRFNAVPIDEKLNWMDYTWYKTPILSRISKEKPYGRSLNQFLNEKNYKKRINFAKKYLQEINLQINLTEF